MNKFKKILLGALSVLTLGLFVVSGTKVTAASAQPYVNAVFSSITQDKDGNDISANFSGEKTISVNGFDFKTAGSGTMLSGNSNGFKMNGSDNKITFTTLDTAKITVVFYIDKDNGDKEAAVSNDDSTNPISITGLKKSSAIAETTVSGDYKYSVTNSNSGKDVSVNIFAGPAAKYTVSNSKAKTIYVKSIRIQPYASVTYNMNGGSALPSTAPTTVLYGDTFTPSTETTKDGYTFAGWYTNSGLTDAYDSTALVLDNVSLYAKWADNNAVYEVTFMNGETQYGDAISISYDSNGDATIGALMPANPSKVGYSFDGWYTAPTGGTKITVSTTISSSMVTNKAITLYAQFVPCIIAKNTSESLNISDVSSKLTDSADTFSSGNFIISEKSDKPTGFGVTSGDFKFNANGTDSEGAMATTVPSGGNYISFVIPANTIAKVALYGKAGTTNTGYLRIYGNGTGKNVSFTSNSNYETRMAYIVNDSDSSQNVYIYRVEGKSVLVKSLLVEVVENASTTGATALVNVDAEANSDKSVIRLITTISGVELANIDTIELVLTKNGTATKNPIYLSTVYTSVTGASSLYSEGTNDYYAIARITSAQSIKGATITINAIVTFADGSTCTMLNAKSFIVPSA